MTRDETASRSARPTAGGPSRTSPLRRLRPHAVVIVVGVLIFFPEVIGLDATTPFVQLSAFRVPIVTLLVPLSLLAVLLTRFRRRWPITVLMVVVAAAGFIAPRAIAGAPGGAGPEVRVLSLNVDNGSADVAALAALIRTERPDLVVMPEAGGHYVAALQAAVPDMGYRSYVGGPSGTLDGLTTAVLARPELGGQVASPDGARFGWVRLEGGPLGVTVQAVHVAAPVPGQTGKWTEDMTALTGLCRTGRPVIVVGDFNSTLDNAGFRRMADGCQDAASARGKGLTGTWPDFLPSWLGMQIDHVLVGGGLAAQRAEIVDIPDTDHRALLTTLQSEG